MKLFRRHTAAFQRQIDASGSFVQDTSRKYNRGGDKNAAKFYFYASSEEVAKTYRQFNACGDEIATELHIYEVTDAKLLDLRKKSNRAKCIELINYLKKGELESVQMSILDYDRAIDRAKDIKKVKERRSTIALHERLKRESEEFAANYSVEDVIEDKRFGGLSLWGQSASDFGAGLALKEDLQRLGYDGVIFEDYARIEVALIKPAKEII